jgi:hypothetical protein
MGAGEVADVDMIEGLESGTFSLPGVKFGGRIIRLDLESNPRLIGTAGSAEPVPCANVVEDSEDDLRLWVPAAAAAARRSARVRIGNGVEGI